MHPNVVLVNGLSASGKTTLGKRVAEAMGLPFFAKDEVKERLFDTVGYSDREWAHRLSGATHAVLNYVLTEQLRHGGSFVLEANFNPAYDTAKFGLWQASYGARFVQLLLHARGEVLVERFRRRVESGERHPGHADGANLEAYHGYLMQGRCEPLALGCPVIEVDTTLPDRIDIAALVLQIRSALER